MPLTVGKDGQEGEGDRAATSEGERGDPTECRGGGDAEPDHDIGEVAPCRKECNAKCNGECRDDRRNS